MTTASMSSIWSKDILEMHLLPHLSARSLGSLACTCKDLHTLVTSTSTDIWSAAAAPVLGPQHPALLETTADQPVTSSSVRAALQLYSQACQNLYSGTPSIGDFTTPMNVHHACMSFPAWTPAIPAMNAHLHGRASAGSCWELCNRY